MIRKFRDPENFGNTTKGTRGTRGSRKNSPSDLSRRDFHASKGDSKVSILLERLDFRRNVRKIREFNAQRAHFLETRRVSASRI